MLQDTLSKIEDKIQSSPAIKEENRAELLRLLGTLKSEIGELSKTHEADARRIAELAEASTQQATHGGQTPEQLKNSANSLAASVAGFEETHPKLVAAVNRISTVLANMGI